MLPGELPLALWVLLGSMAFILLLLMIGQFRLRARLSRIEVLLVASVSQQPVTATDADSSGGDQSEHKRLFQIFLEEDPRREQMPKKDQFAAFRKWRSEQGLNWGQPGS